MSIPYNTIQKVRHFLTALDMPPSPYADAGEVLALLTASVRRRRGEAAIRERFLELIEELQDHSGTDLAGLPAPNDESIDASALARELELVLAEQPPAGPVARQRMLAAVLILALLLIGLALNISCASSKDDTDNSVACIEDISTDHFAELIAPVDDLTPAQRQEAIEDYGELGASEQEEMIADLCGMSADQIADYLESEFGLSGDDDTLIPDDDTADLDDDTDNQPDDDVVYKGISF
jgi:hypothetical protein